MIDCTNDRYAKKIDINQIYGVRYNDTKEEKEYLKPCPLYVHTYKLNFIKLFTAF